MNCHQVQSNLSLYLYGELDFAAEDGVEEHLNSCAFCQRALQREKSWHASLQSQAESAPLDLLSACREQLLGRLPAERAGFASEAKRSTHRFSDWLDQLLPPTPGSVFGSWARSPWPARMAVASFLLGFGFYAGRWQQERPPDASPFRFAGPMTATVSGLQPYTRVRDIEANADGQVRLLVDAGQAAQLTGTPQDHAIRQLLLIAVRTAPDPAVRFDSVERLAGQTGADIRDALLASVQRDANAAVRIKALEGLRPFTSDAATRKALLSVLQHDENPGVRSAAIDMLAASEPGVSVAPEVLGVLQQLLDAKPGDEYVRERGTEALHRAKAASLPPQSSLDPTY